MKRFDERLEGMRSLADFCIGPEPQPVAQKPDLRPVAAGMAAEIGERISALDRQINALCHEFGRLDRAIRG